MNDLFDRLSDQLSRHRRARNVPPAGRSFRCRWERPLFFRNGLRGCQEPLAHEPLAELLESMVFFGSSVTKV